MAEKPGHKNCQSTKQTIIHHAVTRGLDPDAPLRDSGVDWIGQIPAHWEVIKIQYLAELITGYPFISAEFVQDESAIRLLRGINVTPSGIRWESVVRWKRDKNDVLNFFELEAGDIVLGMDRPIISSGVRASLIKKEDTPSLLVQRVARLRPKCRIKAKYLLVALNGRMFATYMTPIFTGISVPHLSPKQITDFRMPVPPLDEQAVILTQIDTQTATINAAIARTEQEIKLLQEYRTRLVADVVTGQLDVRGAVQYLPADDEPLPVLMENEMAYETEEPDEIPAEE